MKTFFYFLLFSLHLTYGQLESLDISNSQTTNQNMTIAGFSYPLFMNGEKHASFLIDYRLSEKLQIELQGFYNTYITSNRFRTSIGLKRYLTKKLYVFGGIEMEAADYKGIFPSQRPRIGALMGFGYDVLTNFVIEGKFNAQLNSTFMGAYGEPFVRMPQVYTIGANVKF